MKDDTADLPALIASRICHDLINPIGAILNGLELLELAGSAQGPEFELIADSAEHASARIRFLRIAYGAPGDHVLARADILALLGQIGNGSRMQVTWQPQDAKPRSEVRLAFLAMQCCETAMPRGGQVNVIEENGDWTVVGTAAESLNVDPDLWSGLQATGNGRAVAPAQIQFALLPAAAASLGRRVEADPDGFGVTLRF